MAEAVPDEEEIVVVLPRRQAALLVGLARDMDAAGRLGERIRRVVLWGGAVAGGMLALLALFHELMRRAP